MRKVIKSGKLVYGVGVNDADYSVTRWGIVNGKRKQVWECPFYRTWRNMLVRCYSEKCQLKHPTYKDCSVCDEWLTFSNFKAWMEQQDWQGKEIDKDLLKKGNNIYCPEWCIFVDAKINTFVTDSRANRGKHMIGACWHKSNGKFQANCHNPFTDDRNSEFLGYFTTELEAHLAWKRKKHEHACKLADSDIVTDPRLAEVLRTKYANITELEEL